MEQNGITLDCDLLTDLGESLADRTIELTKRIHEEAGHEFNVDSTKQLAGRVIRRAGSGGRAQDQDGTQHRRGHAASTGGSNGPPESPPLVLEYRELSKLKKHLHRHAAEDDLPAHRTGSCVVSSDRCGHRTAVLQRPELAEHPDSYGPRPAHSRGYHRRRTRSGAPDGGLLADRAAPARPLLPGRRAREGLRERAGYPPRRRCAGQRRGTRGSDAEAARSAAKAVNFGIIYGQTPFGLSRSIGVPVDEARAFIDMYFMRYPGIRLFIDRCVEDARRTGYAEYDPRSTPTDRGAGVAKPAADRLRRADRRQHRRSRVQPPISSNAR